MLTAFGFTFDGTIIITISFLAIAKCFAQGSPESFRTDRVGFYLPRLAGFDASQQVFPEITKALFSQGDRK